MIKGRDAPLQLGRSFRSFAQLGLILAGASCASPGGGPSESPTAPAVTPAPSPHPALAKSPHKVDDPPPAPSEPLLLVTDRQALSPLEAAGFDLGTVLGTPPTANLARVTNRLLLKNSAYSIIVRELRRDAAEVKAQDPLAGVHVGRFSHRLIDIEHLRRDDAHFELVALANRFDRQPFHSESCGELRLIYRLAYKTQQKTASGEATVWSRLPVTLGIEAVLPQDSDDCRSTLRRLSPPPELSGVALGNWLVEHKDALRPLFDKARVQIVLNAQVVRWPSTVNPSMAGHAEYVLRAFRFDAEEKLKVHPLENTLDLRKLRANPKLRQKLLDYLRTTESLRDLDNGTLVIPDQYLATKSVSVSPRGLSRRANRVALSLFQPRDFAGQELSGFKRIRTAEALLRRLDDMSCAGCHQSRSVAGFHILGDDPSETVAGNALRVTVSPHVQEDLPRRKAVLSAALEGAPIDFSRGFAERADDAPGSYGAHCGLQGQFPEWTCDAGLQCDRYDAPDSDAFVGQCLPHKPLVGDPCEVGTVVPQENPRRERVSSIKKRRCVNASCNTNAVGFPGGVCRSSCSSLTEDGACGALADLRPFNACLARREPFTHCLENHAVPAGLRACDESNHCRDDYVCVRLPSETNTTGSGACIPPYFLFQLRVDGHP